jgi:phycoerythrin-associated linker protein
VCYFESCAPYRFVELNFKHLLGRAPSDQAELSQHICLCVESGYEAEIDSYLDSDEYQAKFGENIVPYYQGSQTQVGQKNIGYNRTLSLYQGYAGVDSAFTDARLVAEGRSHDSANSADSSTRIRSNQSEPARY